MRINEIDLYKLHSNPDELNQQDVRVKGSLTRRQFFKKFVFPEILNALGTDKLVRIVDDYTTNPIHSRIVEIIIDGLNSEKLLYQRPTNTIEQPLHKRTWEIAIVYPAAEKYKDFKFVELVSESPDYSDDGPLYSVTWYLPQSTFNLFKAI